MSSGPPPTESPAEAAAQAAAGALNVSIASTFCIVQLIFVAVFFLLLTPSIAHHLASNRLSQGWSLKRNAKPTLKHRSRHSIMAFVEGPNRLAGAVPGVNGKVAVALRGFYNRWMLGTVPVFGFTVGQMGVLALYAGLIVFSATYKLGGAGATNPTRFGFVATAQIPATFILAMKNNPISILGKGYEKLNFLHRFAGRMFLLFGLIHGGYYYADEIASG